MPFSNVTYQYDHLKATVLAVFSSADGSLTGLAKFHLMERSPEFTTPYPLESFFQIPADWERCTGLVLILGTGIPYAALGRVMDLYPTDPGGWAPLPRKVGGALLWSSVDNIQWADVNLPWVDVDATPHLRLQWSHKNGWVLDADKPSLLLPGANGTSLYAWPGTDDPCPITANADESLSLGSSATGKSLMAMGCGGTDKPSIALLPAQAGIATAGASLGVLSFTGANAPGFGSLPIGFAFNVVPATTVSSGPPAASCTLFYPLVDPAAHVFPVVGSLTPPLSGAAAQATLRLFQGTTFTSNYRCTTGVPLTLTTHSRSDATFTLQPTVDGTLVLSPAQGASFAIAPLQGSLPVTMLCGLSGLEGVELSGNDTLTTSPLNCWVEVVTAAQTGGKPSYRFVVDNKGGTNYGSCSLLTLANGGTAEQYLVQSQLVPFYAVVASNSGPQSYNLQTVSAGKLPSPTPAVPILPYAATCAPASPWAALAGVYQQVETGCLAPYRCTELLEAIETSGQDRGMGDTTPVHTVTPQRFIATLQPDGTQTFTLAQICFATCNGQTVQMKGTEGALDGFLESQPFFVITQIPTGVTYNNPTLKISGWQFNLGLPAQGVAPGVPQTILLIKAAGSTIAQLVANPATWTDYARFNNTANDPQGVELSAYLIGYIANAKQMQAAGVGGLEEFLKLVEDETWSGILYLSPPAVAPSNNPALDAFLIGVDPSQLYAHHLGISSTSVSVQGSTIMQTSSMFGLVHYMAPGTNLATVLNTNPGYIPGSDDYALQVMLLHAAFANSAMTAFRSVAWLMIDQILGDPVDATYGNIIPLFGSAQIDAAGNGTYALSMAPGVAYTIGIVGAALRSMTVNSIAAAIGNGSALFTLCGSLETVTTSASDVLSYAAIAFQTYQLGMTYTPHSGKPPVIWEIPGSISLMALAETQGAPALGTMPGSNLYRANSLSSQMPTTVNSLLIGTGASLPASLGFSKVICTPDTGSSAFAPQVTDPWYGLLVNIDLGGDGSSGSQKLFAGQLLYAWQPGSSAPRSVAVFFRLTGPGGLTLSFQIENVISIGAKSLALALNSAGQYVLTLQSLGVTLLGTSLPQPGSANLLLAGFQDSGGTRSMGWLGGYVNPSPLS